MKKRIQALKAIILVVLMVVELFGVDALRALAESISEDTTIEADTSADYETYGPTLTINEGVTASGTLHVSNGKLVNEGTASGAIYVSGGELVNRGTAGSKENKVELLSGGIVTNNGTIDGIVASSGTITNAGTISDLSVTGTDVTITQNSGLITTLTSEYNGNVILAGGTVTMMQGTMNVETTGTATVGTMSGAINLSGTGTLKVTDALNLANGYAEGNPIVVKESTVITAPAENPIQVTCDGITTFRLQNVSGQTLVDAMGNTIQAQLQSPGTMKSETEFPSTKQLRGKAPVTAVYMAQDGYYFPENYSTSVSDAAAATAVTEVSDDQQSITVKLTLVKDSQNITVTFPAATAKASQAAPEGLIGGVEKVSGVTSDMEYSRSLTAKEWNSIEGIADSGTGTVDQLEKGVWYFRYKETNTKKAGEAVPVTVLEKETTPSETKVVYLPAPEHPYTLSGTKGNNGYYISDVSIVPAAGYLIALKQDGTYQQTLTVRNTTGAFDVYLKKIATGECTEAIRLGAIKIKQGAPKLSLENGRTYYGAVQSLLIQDAYLHQVYVNGVLQNLTGTEMALTLGSNNGRKRYEITAVDDAGNQKTIIIHVAAAWMRTGIVPDGVLVNLESGNGYKLGSGNWQVEGDTTSYSGNAAFYVRKDGSYTFKSH